MTWTSMRQAFQVLIRKLLTVTLKCYKPDLFHTAQIELICFNGRRDLQFNPDKSEEWIKIEVKKTILFFTKWAQGFLSWRTVQHWCCIRIHLSTNSVNYIRKVNPLGNSRRLQKTWGIWEDSRPQALPRNAPATMPLGKSLINFASVKRELWVLLHLIRGYCKDQIRAWIQKYSVTYEVLHSEGRDVWELSNISPSMKMHLSNSEELRAVEERFS